MGCFLQTHKERRRCRRHVTGGGARGLMGGLICENMPPGRSGCSVRKKSRGRLLQADGAPTRCGAWMDDRVGYSSEISASGRSCSMKRMGMMSTAPYSNLQGTLWRLLRLYLLCPIPEPVPRLVSLLWTWAYHQSLRCDAS